VWKREKEELQTQYNLATEQIQENKKMHNDLLKAINLLNE